MACQLLFIVFFVALTIGNLVSMQGAGGLASAGRSSMQPSDSLPFLRLGLSCLVLGIVVQSLITSFQGGT